MTNVFFFFGFLGVGGDGVKRRRKVSFSGKNGCTPNYFFQDIGGTPYSPNSSAEAVR